MRAAAGGAGGGGGESAADGGSDSRPASAGAGAGSTGQAGTASSAGGKSGGEDSSGAYTFSQCPNAMPTQGNLNDLPACDGSVQCGAPSHCFPLDRLKTRLSDALIDRTPDCSAGKCLPDAIVSAGKIRFNVCTGDLGEGRCIPQCFAVWVMPLSAIFERGAFGCGSQEVCAPCLNPLTQEPSGACESDVCAAETEM
jgi:hypothetical protein